MRILLNLTCVLLCFQAVFGLNINLNKFELTEFRDRGKMEYLLGCWDVNQFKILALCWVPNIKKEEAGSQ